MAGPVNASKTKVVIPTIIQTSSDFIDYWSSMTCLYDPLWNADQNRDRVTLPIAFFHVTGMREVGKTEVSKKRVILYEPQVSTTSEELSNAVRPSVMRAIMDNAVRDAKTYVINAVLPYQPLGRYVTDGISVIVNTIGVFTALIGKYDSKFMNYFSSAMSMVMAATDVMSSAAEIVGKLPSMDGVSYINKNSLEAMWESTHFLCMKLWTGYEYKFVMITNIEIEKKGNEDDVFRVNIEVQEMPVLTLTKPKQLRLDPIDRNWAAKAVSAAETAVSSVLTKITGVKDASKTDAKGVLK